MTLLPEHWPLSRVAAELGKATHVLVSASRRGQFPPVVKVGGCWMVSAEAVREWFGRNHATPPSQQTALEMADLAAGCSGRRGRRRRVRGSSDSFA